MSQHVWYFVVFVLTALLMGTTFGHTLEMPAKMGVDGQLWLTIQQTLYPYFRTIGAPIEIGAILSAGILSFTIRNDTPSFYLALVTTFLVAAALVMWVLFVNPVNVMTATWTADSIPADWMRWRSQWEYGHALRFVLHVIGFGASVIAALIKKP